jgi:hypothetical protein
LSEVIAAPGNQGTVAAAGEGVIAPATTSVKTSSFQGAVDDGDAQARARVDGGSCAGRF